MQTRLAPRLVSVLALLSLAACGSGDPGTPTDFDELLIRVPDRMQPLVCKEENAGARFSTDGYLHWPTDGSLGTDSTFLLDLYAENDAEGRGVGDRVSMMIEGRTAFGIMGHVEEPILHGSTERSVIGGTEVVGSVDDDELAVHLEGGGTANGRTHVNVTVELLYLNGGCSFEFVSARAL